MRDDRQRIMDMLEAIGNIERFVSEDYVNSPDQELLNVWVIHRFKTGLEGRSERFARLEETIGIYYQKRKINQDLQYKEIVASEEPLSLFY